MQNRKYITTAEACEILGTYGSHLWSLIGRGLSPPKRISPKRVFWLASEVRALADQTRELKARLQA